ncbi:MAG: NAD-dependent epimerase/dehydratase family protein [Chlamydiia bacterium]|nr:NAD-dependent epimerase/dehydratase family protein [Chlamydiia bacterium]
MQVLITGAAGFIGFHLALALKKRGDTVIGLDNFNAYYDPQLKRERAKILKTHGMEIVEADIRDQPLIEQLLQKKEISHFIHLAAQAGVRHSLIAPNDYVASNLQGFVSVLEACRKHPGIKFIFASSSSVYGLNEKIPFSTEDPTDRPTNFYGATKKANELIAHAYHHLYGLAVTGLRFFTVYGPWGRPDMAYYRFCEKICRGEPIQLFNQGNMARDFTYIDDIVRGIIAAIDLGAPCEIFNLGNHQPVPLLRLVEILEERLEKKAIRQFLPMQPGEVLTTYADIEKSQRLLGFHPRVSLEEGLAHFVEWFQRSLNHSTAAENR